MNETTTAKARSRSWRRFLSRQAARLGWLAGGAAATLAALYASHVAGMPAIEPWHRIAPAGEIRHDDDPPRTFAEYVAREENLFRELERLVSELCDPDDPRHRVNRYNSKSPSYGVEHAGNRTRERSADRPAGVALLLHGLSDAPYSMHALADVLESLEFHTIVLRIPGHGTTPAALAEVEMEDWTLAVRLATRRLDEVRQAASPPEGSSGGTLPFLLAGYSNGAALAVDYTAQTMTDATLPRPDGLLLVSPAIAVTRLAALASSQLLLSRLPRLEKLGWQSTQPEYDPFKYNSFPINAARQIYRLTKRLHNRIARLPDPASTSPPERFPPVLAVVSAVDATIPIRAVIDRLLARIGPNGSELVVFDTNREATIRPFLPEAVERTVDSLTGVTWPFGVRILTNRSPETAELCEVRIEDGESTRRDLDLAWPDEVYSLSHVALPFRPDDPFYGRTAGPRTHVTLGNIEPRGERGVLVVPAGQFLRLRSNPFFPYLEETVREWVAGLPGGAASSRPTDGPAR